MMSDNLFDKIGVSVFKTDLTRKITLNGETSALPVYKIKLSELFYNDKNDRIATSIDSYNRNHDKALNPGKNEEYNKVKLEKSVEKLNSFLKDEKTHAEYEFHEDLNRIMVRIVNDETDEVILEVPPKKIIDAVAALCEAAGVLLDEKA